MPQSPFLMSGKGDVIGRNVQINLVRAAAKIEVIAKNEFVIESVTVKNTPDKGYIFDNATLETPVSSNMAIYPANTTNSIVYVAENSKKKPTEIVVAGRYLGKKANYTIVLKNEGLPVDIVRNTIYQVSISAIDELNCNVSVTIPIWKDVAADKQVIMFLNRQNRKKTIRTELIFYQLATVLRLTQYCSCLTC